MLRAEKAKLVDELNAVFNASGVVVVTHYKGMTVPEVTDLRVKMRAAGASFRVTKNRLVKLALAETDYSGMADMFTGPTAIAYSEDPVSAPKVVAEFAKKNDKLVIMGGGMGATILDTDAVKALADMPSMDELRAKIIALINTPASRLVGVLQAPGGQLARVMQAKADQG